MNGVILSNSWPRSWDWDNPIERKAKKNYEAQSITNPPLRMKFKTKTNFIKETKKKLKSTRANFLNSWLEPWCQDYLMEDKPKKSHET